MSEQDPTQIELPRHEMEIAIKKNERFIHDSMAVLRMENTLGVYLFPAVMSQAISSWSDKNGVESVVMSLEFSDYERNRNESKLRTIYEISQQQAITLKQIYGQYFPEAEL